jgi:transposase
MMGTLPSNRQPALFSCRIDLERRVDADHLLRQVSSTLDLGFVIPTVRHHYGRSGNVSLDPRVIVKLLLLLFLYDISSERELMEQIGVRLDFLWFLGFDLDTEIPHHSVLSKARARWGTELFEQLFVQTVTQCVQAGLVQGRLLHIDSTMVKAQAAKDSVVASGPELVGALRQAYRQQAAKLQVLPTTDLERAAKPEVSLSTPEPASDTEPAGQSTGEPTGGPGAQAQPGTSAATTPPLRILPQPAASATSPPRKKAKGKKATGQKLPINSTHLSTTDPEAELARSKNGLSELNYKDHRLVDDAHGVITALAATTANVADGTQLPVLYEQHLHTTGLALAQVTVAGDHHYGTASNFVFCEESGLRAHLAPLKAPLEARGKLPLSQFVYEPQRDRLRCRAGHYLVRQQNRPQEQAIVYLIAEAAACANCALRKQCTQSKRGRSIQRPVRAELLEASPREADSPAGRYSRKRRQHVMEGSFADAVNNHGAKKARWRGLWRQQIQSWLIAAVQNLRLLLNHRVSGPVRGAAASLVEVGENAKASLWRPIAGLGELLDGCWSRSSCPNPEPAGLW